MPIYEFECPKCGNSWEKYTSDNTDKCQCGKTVKKIMSKPAIHMGKAGSADGKSDSYWRNSDVIQERELKKRKEQKQEKLHYSK